MATYVNNLRLKEITTGDEDGTWGTSTNTNLELITDGFSYGTKEIAADANETFTMPDATADATRSFYLKITSAVSLTATREVTLGPNTVSKVWLIENATSGSQAITIKQGTGATVDVANGAKVMLVTDGAGAGAAVIDASTAGGVSYVTKTANYTTANLEGVLADTSGGAFTVTLPASPSAGDQVVIADAGASFGSNNLTVGRNSSTINGVAENLILDITGVNVQFVYDGSTWRVYAQVGGNSGSVVTLDGVQTLTNKDLTSGTNTFPSSLATLAGTETLTNKTIAFGDNTLTDVAGTSATQTLTNKTIAFGDNTLTDVAGTSATQTLTNKTIRDTVYSLTGTAFDATNGAVQTKTLAANTTFTDSLTSGDAIVLQLEAGASYTVTWPTMQWVTSGGNVAPTLTAKDTLVFWKVSTTLYGAYTGSYV